MKKTNVLTALPTHSDTTMDRALNLLAAGGLDFEVVDRCPGACEFCDDELTQAA